MSALRGPNNEPHFSVDFASIGANLGLSGTTAIDTTAMVAGNRVLAKDQTTGSQNGIWVVQAGAWTRAPDFGGAALIQQDVPAGHRVMVTSGATNAGTEWVNTNTGLITPATTALTYKRFDGAWDEWETLYHASGLLAGGALTNTYLLRYDGGTPIASTSAQNAGTAFLPLDPAQFAVLGKTLQVRLAAYVMTNSTAPGVTFTFGLHPINSMAALVPTTGTVVTTVAIATPALNTMTRAWGTAVTMPAAGQYVLDCAINTTAAAATQILGCALQMRAI